MSDVPDAYGIGWVPFFDTRIFLDSRPLIPRAETEYWTERAVKDVAEREHTVRVLDLFAGSGCIGIAVLAHAPASQVDFAEIDASHFPTIEKNLEENSIPEERTRIIRSDVWSGVEGRYDFVLANPPYLSRSRIERIEPSVLQHEPELALMAEGGGFEFIEKTLRGLAEHLLPGGVLYIEHEPEHAEHIQILGTSLGFGVENRKDQYGVLRFSILKPIT